MKNSYLIFNLIIFSLFTNASYAKSYKHEISEDVESSVKILSTSPSTSEELHVGEHVKLKVKVAYTLKDESGEIHLVIESADNSAIAFDTEVLTKGSGEINFEKDFVVPYTKALQVFVPLHNKGQLGTNTVDMWAFKVIEMSLSPDMKKRVSEAKLAASTKEGGEYEILFAPLVKSSMNSCIANGSSNDENAAEFQFVSYVKVDGVLNNPTVEPGSKISECFKKEFSNKKLPIPPVYLNKENGYPIEVSFDITP